MEKEAVELDDRDVSIHLHPPPLHPTNMDATILDTVVGKAAVMDVAEAVDYPLLRPTIQPPPCLSLWVGHTHFQLPTHQAVGAIFHPCPRRR